MNKFLLLLIGTVHRDPTGATKLKTLLDEYEPTLITVEISPHGVEYRQKNRNRLTCYLDGLLRQLSQETGKPYESLQKHSTVELLKTTLELPFEYSTALSWSTEHGVPLHCVDDSERSKKYLELFETESLTLENLRYLLFSEKAPVIAERVIEQILLAQKYTRNPGMFPYHYSDDEIAEIEHRDCLMAKKILTVHKQRDQDSLLHIGGWEHLVITPKLKTLAYFLQKEHKLPLKRKLIGFH